MANTAIKPRTTEWPRETSIPPMVLQVWVRQANVIINIVSVNAWIEYESLIIKILNQINPKDASAVCYDIFDGLLLATEDDKTQVALFMRSVLSFTWLLDSHREAIKNYIKKVLSHYSNHIVSMDTGSLSVYDTNSPPQDAPWVKLVSVPHLMAVLFPKNGSLTK